MSITKNPVVSIGLPVYNGEKYLVAAIQSFLDQSFVDFELIISDNASTDRTEEICKSFVPRDPRIRYFRNRVNVGATRNHNIVYELSTGYYFKWAGHDDLYAPNYLAECVEVLDRDPDIVLCYPKTILIDDSGRETGRYEENDLDLNSPYPHERLHNILHHPLDMLLSPAYGLARMRCMAKTSGYGNYYGADRVVLEELTLQGVFTKIPEYLFYRRMHLESSSVSNPYYSGSVQGSRWKRFLGNLNGIRRASLSPRERFLCYREFWSFYSKLRRVNGVWLDIKQFLAARKRA